MTAPRAWPLWTLGLLIPLGAILSLSVGPAAVGPLDWLTESDPGARAIAAVIIGEIRLPRTLLCLLVGGALGLSGAGLQGLFRNPLAEPGVIGISAFAALGAVIALYSGLSARAPLLLPLLAIGGALLSASVLYLLAAGRTMTTLILAGVALSSLAGALTALALNLSPNPFAAYEVLFWLLGSVADRTLLHVGLAAPFVALGGGLLLATGRGLDTLTLGEDAAIGMGTDLRRLTILAVGGTALAVGAAVAVSGVIGFVGLVVPHLLRPLAGHRPSVLLPLSALGGAALVLAADIAVRLLPTPGELKLGVVTALIGAPFFLWLVLRERRIAP